MLSTILIYCIVGAIAGLMAGLLGIGGGAVIVPLLLFTFKWLNFPPDTAIHIAIGTSLASIIFTSLSSAGAHNKKGFVRWDIFKTIALGILIGTYCGSYAASLIPGKYLQIFFALFLYYVGFNMLLNKKPNPTRTLPGFAGMTGAGLFIGTISSFVGIGGGTLSVPFMIWHNVDIRNAIGTSAAIGFPIALAGCAGNIIHGWNTANLPEFSLGYVYLPALIGIITISTLTAPIGARIAHNLPIPKLKKIFACFLFFAATKIFLDVL